MVLWLEIGHKMAKLAKTICLFIKCDSHPRAKQRGRKQNLEKGFRIPFYWLFYGSQSSAGNFVISNALDFFFQIKFLEIGFWLESYGFEVIFKS